MNNFDYEIEAINREILALKTEKQKRIEQLVVGETSITLTATERQQFRIKASPKNNVTPLISYYVNSEVNQNITASSVQEFDVDEFYIILTLVVATAGTYEVVFVSTSELNLEII